MSFTRVCEARLRTWGCDYHNFRLGFGEVDLVAFFVPPLFTLLALRAEDFFAPSIFDLSLTRRWSAVLGAL